jgi:hypothetical protein
MLGKKLDIGAVRGQRLTQARAQGIEGDIEAIAPTDRLDLGPEELRKDLPRLWNARAERQIAQEGRRLAGGKVLDPATVPKDNSRSAEKLDMNRHGCLKFYLLP